MKESLPYIVGGVLLALICIFLFNYQNNKIAVPTVGENGKVSGLYTIEGIEKLGKPYVCTFEKADSTSKISGTIRTDGQKIYGEFKINTDLIKNGFNSFIIIKDNIAYIWTSLQNVGYKSPAVKSASANASPQDQAQIIGTQDKIQYECEPWSNADNYIFEIPTSTTFLELKK
jgi:hypothetical protein